MFSRQVDIPLLLSYQNKQQNNTTSLHIAIFRIAQKKKSVTSTSKSLLHIYFVTLLLVLFCSYISSILSCVSEYFLSCLMSVRPFVCMSVCLLCFFVWLADLFTSFCLSKQPHTVMCYIVSWEGTSQFLKLLPYPGRPLPTKKYVRRFKIKNK